MTNDENVLNFIQKIREDNAKEFEFQDYYGNGYRCTQLYIGSGKVVYSSSTTAPRLRVPLTAPLNPPTPTAIVVTPGDSNGMVYLMPDHMAPGSLLLHPTPNSYEFPPNVKYIFELQSDLTREWNEKYLPQYWEALEDIRLWELDVKDCEREARRLLVNGEEFVEKKPHYSLTLQNTADYICGGFALENYAETCLGVFLEGDRLKKTKQKKIQELCRAGNVLTETEKKLAEALRKLKEKGVNSVIVVARNRDDICRKKMSVKTLLKYLGNGKLFLWSGLGTVEFKDIISLQYNRQEIYSK